MRYQFGGVVQTKTNLILWNQYIVGPLELYITSRATCLLRMDFLFDTYKVKIATLIYNIYNRITPPCLEHIIQRKEHKYDLRHQHCVRTQRFETYVKNSISRRGSIVWNILKPTVFK